MIAAALVALVVLGVRRVRARWRHHEPRAVRLLPPGPPGETLLELWRRGASTMSGRCSRCNHELTRLVVIGTDEVRYWPHDRRCADARHGGGQIPVRPFMEPWPRAPRPVALPIPGDGVPRKV